MFPPSRVPRRAIPGIAALLVLPALLRAQGQIVPVPGEGYQLKMVSGKPSAEGAAGDLGFLVTVTTGNRFLAVQALLQNRGSSPVEVNKQTLQVLAADGTPIVPMKPRVYLPIRFSKTKPIEIDAQGNPTTPGPSQGLNDGGLDTITAEKMSKNWYLDGVRLSREERFARKSYLIIGGTLVPGERKFEKVILQRNQLEPPFTVVLTDGRSSTRITFGRGQ